MLDDGLAVKPDEVYRAGTDEERGNCKDALDVPFCEEEKEDDEVADFAELGVARWVEDVELVVGVFGDGRCRVEVLFELEYIGEMDSRDK